MKSISIITCFLFTLNLSAQTKKQKDRAAIKKMCGCYEITFNFSETFDYVEDSSYIPSPNKIAYALEWVDLTYEDQNNMILQHILQMGSDSNAYIIKHWRQDWNYQNSKLLSYDYDNRWIHEKLFFNQYKGQWTQKVFQVDDSPRYESSATWVHVDGKSFWETEVDAPLPRRERTIRSDYNVLKRFNRVQINDEGWAHKQDNLKILRSKDNEVIIAREYGNNIYKKVDDDRCRYAKKWWESNQSKWQIVRNVWNETFDASDTITLKKSVEEQPLWNYLFSDEYSSQSEIELIINKFLEK